MKQAQSSKWIEYNPDDAWFKMGTATSHSHVQLLKMVLCINDQSELG